ncbi:MAG: DUF1016 N-terminal domain-containing protein [Cardiobacteriaceae bacterium]|nr:DUF1016 N-terminal domain-containing protein [Cardiobacteriaceae bacterium]
MTTQNTPDTLINSIAAIIEQARQHIRHSVNTAMVQSYWEIGRLIVEDEQHGEKRAAYGKAQLQTLSKALTARLGKGFDVTNLRNMRAFYLAFPIRETVSPVLSWSHYNRLTRIESPDARQWYMQEAISQN